MTGQGAAIIDIAKRLIDQHWCVLFKCIPNAPHVGVVPIPIKHGAARQRYPDILSYKGNCLRITEVEVGLSENVVEKTIERFSEQRAALADPEIWHPWKNRVKQLTGQTLADGREFVCELVTCRRIRPAYEPLVSSLQEAGIEVYDLTTFSCS